ARLRGAQHGAILHHSRGLSAGRLAGGRRLYAADGRAGSREPPRPPAGHGRRRGRGAAVFDPRLRGRGRLPAFPPRPPHTRAGEVNDKAPSRGFVKGRLHRWTALFFHQPRAGVPCLAGLFAGYVVTMLELVEDEGVQLFGVYLAVFGEYALLGG